MFLGSKARLAYEADNLTPSVSGLSRQCGMLNISHLSTVCYEDSFTFSTFTAEYVEELCYKPEGGGFES
jgi:hypothetical protein